MLLKIIGHVGLHWVLRFNANSVDQGNRVVDWEVTGAHPRALNSAITAAHCAGNILG